MHDESPFDVINNNTVVEREGVSIGIDDYANHHIHERDGKKFLPVGFFLLRWNGVELNIKD